jgi:YD repeat-containing protein
MKKFNFIMCALAITGTLFISSCGKDDDDDSKGNAKQVSALVSSDSDGDKDSIVFTYNASGVLTKAEDYDIATTKELIYSMDFEYKDNKMVSITSYEWDGTTKSWDDKDSISYDSNNRPEKLYDFYYSSGKPVLSSYVTTITYNSNDLPVKYTYDSDEYQTCEYDGNSNVIKALDYYNDVLYYSNTFTYDTKKNPFKGNYCFMGEFSFYNTNNCTADVEAGFSTTYTYEYDSDGYPTKVTSQGSYSSSKKHLKMASEKHLKMTSEKHLKMASESYSSVDKIYYK